MDFGADEGASRARIAAQSETILKCYETIKDLTAEVERLTKADNESVRSMMAAMDEVDRLNLALERRGDQALVLGARLVEANRRNDTQADSIIALLKRVKELEGVNGPT